MGGDGTLVKITDLEGQVTGEPGGITYQYLTPDEYDNLVNLQSDYSYISKSFEVEELGELQIPALDGWNLLSLKYLIDKDFELERIQTAYNDAKIFVESNKLCEGCKALFNNSEIKITLCYGQEKFWCKTCYEKIKDD